MSSQTLLKISLPSGALIYPAQFREFLARESNMPSEFFHRDADSRNPLNTLPRVLTIGGRQWVGVLAQPGHERMLYDVINTITHSTSSKTKLPNRVEVQTIDLSVAQTHYPVKYWVREMVINRRTKRAKNLDINQLVAERIYKSLQRFADEYGLDLPSENQLEIEVNVLKNIGLRLQTTQGLTNEYVTLVDVELSLFADLKGYWFVGNMTSRGYGRIGRDLKSLAVNFSKEESMTREVLQ